MALCVQLFLEGARVLVVGGGRLAARRARQLRGEGARVTVLSPSFLPELETGGFDLIRAPYSPDCLEGCLLAAAAAAPEVNRRLARDAAARGILTLAAAPGEGAAARVMKAGQEGVVTIACATGGAFPAANGQLLADLRRAAAPWAEKLPPLGEIRRLLLAQEGDTAGPLLRGLAEKPAGELEVLLHSLREAAEQGEKSGRPA